MTGTPHIVRSVALAMALVAVLGIAVPVCTMPDCDAASLSACSDVAPACDGCGDETVVMKHLPDEAVPVAAIAPVLFAAALPMPPDPAPALVAYTVPVPEATAAPPPLDPLGVRLSI